MSDEEMIDLILDYAKKHPKFDTEFVESVQDALDQYGELTAAQSQALERICDGFNLW